MTFIAILVIIVSICTPHSKRNWDVRFAPLGHPVTAQLMGHTPAPIFCHRDGLCHGDRRDCRGCTSGIRANFDHALLRPPDLRV